MNFNRAQLSSNLSNFYGSSKNVVSKAFTSGTFLSQIAFVILVLIVFFVALRLGSYLLIWMFSPSDNPILIPGRIDAKKMMVFTQDPSLKDSVPIMRSVNEYQGLQFTWSVWINIDDINYKDGEYKHIFHKGNESINNSSSRNQGVAYPSNAPGLYLTDKANELLVLMNTHEKNDEKIKIENIPIGKWLNIIIRVSNQKILDVYINGTLTKRHKLSSAVKQNYGNVYVAMNGGFSGMISDLRYFKEALGTNAIQNIVFKGPNLAFLNDSDELVSEPSYLSTRWYFNSDKVLDGYNPY